MNEDENFETYLFLSLRKIEIFVCKKLDNKIFYKNEFLIKDELREFNFELIDNFLSNNIFKIEKLIKDFIKNIYVIIDYDIFFKVQITLKKYYSGKVVNRNSLSNILIDARNQCHKTFQGKNIIHIFLDNYKIDNKDFKYLPKDLICNNLCLDITFICLPETFIKNLENVLKRYQITLNRFISANYMRELFPNSDLELNEIAKRILDGCNENEVKLVAKSPKNKGFFEKFFHFFS